MSNIIHKPPIFIIGNPRSGTTMFRLMLASHPDIMIPPECGFAVWWMKKWGKWGNKISPSEENLRLFLKDLFQSKKFDTWKILEDELYLYLAQNPSSNYSELIASIYIYYGMSKGQDFHRWGDKNNFHIDYIAEIRRLYPEAVFLHITRDGRDVACSYKDLARRRIDVPYAPRLPDNVEEIAREWNANIRKANDAFDAFDRENVYEVRFEDFILKTEPTLRRLCEQINETYSTEMLRYNEHNKERKLEPDETMSWKRKTLRPPMPNEAGRFKQELEPEEIAAFERVALESLTRYGYL